jgi:hypothetical protein
MIFSPLNKIILRPSANEYNMVKEAPQTFIPNTTIGMSAPTNLFYWSCCLVFRI